MTTADKAVLLTQQETNKTDVFVRFYFMLENDIQCKDSNLAETFGELESDPNGLDQHQTGAKLDNGKARMGLVIGGFSRAISMVSEVGTYGANKYTDNGWMEVENGIDRYTDAMYRHLMSEAGGEPKDIDTDILHSAHIAWNALARLDLMLRKADCKST